MKSFVRPKTIAEVAANIRKGGDAGHEIKDFLHEFQDAPLVSALNEEPEKLEGVVKDGRRFDAFLQALAVYLSCRVDSDPPAWTRKMIQLADPWFASPGAAIRNYLLMSSPTPFRNRNLFIDEDSLSVA
jgi:hypothetical protein